MRILIRCVPAVAACLWSFHQVEGQAFQGTSPPSGVADYAYEPHGGEFHGECEPACSGALGGGCGCTMGQATCIGFPRLFNFQSPCPRPKCGKDPCCTTIFGEMWCDVKGWGAKMRACTLCNSSVYGCSVTDAGFPGHGCKFVMPGFGFGKSGWGGGCTGGGCTGGGCAEPSCGGEYIEPSCDGNFGMCGPTRGGNCFQDLFRPACGSSGSGFLGALFGGGCNEAGCGSSCESGYGSDCGGGYGYDAGTVEWNHNDGYEWQGDEMTNGSPARDTTVEPTPENGAAASRAAARYSSGRSGRSLHYYTTAPRMPSSRVARRPGSQTR